MNKISLISLALSFLFTITSGCVHSSDGEDSSVSSTEQTSSESNTESNDAKADNQGTKKSSTKKIKKKRRGTKRGSKSFRHNNGSRSRGNQYTAELNKNSLTETQPTETIQQ